MFFTRSLEGSVDIVLAKKSEGAWNKRCCYSPRKDPLHINERLAAEFPMSYSRYLEAYLILSAVALWWRITFHTVEIRAHLSRCWNNTTGRPRGDARICCSPKKVGQEFFIIFCWPLLLVLWVAAVFITAGFLAVRFFDELVHGRRTTPEEDDGMDRGDLEKGNVHTCKWRRRGWLVMMRANPRQSSQLRRVGRLKPIGSCLGLGPDGGFKVAFNRPISKAALRRLVDSVVSLQEDGIFREIVKCL